MLKFFKNFVKALIVVSTLFLTLSWNNNNLRGYFNLIYLMVNMVYGTHYIASEEAALWQVRCFTHSKTEKLEWFSYWKDLESTFDIKQLRIIIGFEQNIMKHTENDKLSKSWQTNWKEIWGQSLHSKGTNNLAYSTWKLTRYLAAI